MAKFYVLNEQSEVPVVSGGSTLPMGSAFMSSGIYVVNGISYDCTRQGLYRWWNPAGYFINRVVFTLGTSFDLCAVISAISWNHVHGTGTEQGLDSTSLQLMSNAGRTVKWSSRCGYIATMCAWLMPQLGITARVRNISTLGPKNGYDDGHVVFETLCGTDWYMWDITNGCYFQDSNGKHMGVTDFISCIANNGPMPTRVRLDYDFKYNHDYAGNLDLGLYWSWMLQTPAQLEAWYRRIFQSIV